MRELSKYFVLHRLPKEKNIFLLEDDHPSKINDISELKHKAFIVAPFDSKSNSPTWAFDFKAIKTISEKEISSLRIETKRNTQKNNPIIIKQHEHEETVAKMVSIIKKGELGKGVLSRIKAINRNKESLSNLFIELSKAYPNAFVYLVSLPNDEIWCGASPEVLATYKNKDFHTMALAGTKLLDGRNAEYLVWQEKEQEEQKWVQNHLAEKFSSLNIEFKKSKAYTYQAGHLAHICSNYHSEIRAEDAVKLLSTLHPTPAICGTPTDKARDIIINLEKHSRSYYAGFIGIYSSQEFQLFVNLRCMMINDSAYYLYIGGGITKDSNPEMEWVEIENKAETLGRVIQRVSE